MLVGILKPFRGTVRSMLDVYKQILTHNNIDYIELDVNNPLFWRDIQRIDLFLAKIAQTDDDIALAEQIIPVLNVFSKVRCFPNYPTVWHYDDKVKQYYLLKHMGFPVIDSYIFWDKVNALEWADNTQYPVVFKLKGGAGSSNVKLIKTRRKAFSIIRKAFGRGIHPYYFDILGKFKAANYDIAKISKYFLKPLYCKLVTGTTPLPNYKRHRNYVYFQKFMPGNEHDTRVCILGKRAFAFKRFVRKNDFRASGSNNYDMNRDAIDKEFVKLAFDISKQMGFQSMAYDFVYDKNHRPALIEISYTYGDYPEFSTGYWDEDLVWHDGHYLPEYFELMDALQMPDLKMPEIKLNSPYMHARMKN